MLPLPLSLWKGSCRNIKIRMLGQVARLVGPQKSLFLPPQKWASDLRLRSITGTTVIRCQKHRFSEKPSLKLWQNQRLPLPSKTKQEMKPKHFVLVNLYNVTVTIIPYLVTFLLRLSDMTGQ